ncbi:MAG: prolyl oligopeptidase family serine peptidase [Planctomycetes bacterium]|nr:prolyl oligopeptidase family serine peptidase [Planctomycetota bacterium]
MRLFPWLLLTLALTGCMSTTPAAPPRAVTPLADEVVRRFDYAVIGTSSLALQWEDDVVAVHSGTVTIMVPSLDPSLPDERFPVQFEYWRSKVAPAGAGPAVVVTPILGGGKSLARTNCEDFARAGFHVALAWRGTKVLRRSWTIDDPERWMRKCVAARRALLDWLIERPEVDGDRVAGFGISMGGILTSTLLAVEPRFRCGVVALSGGDLAGIIAVSSEGRIERYFAQRQLDLGIGPVELEQRIRVSMKSDPLLLAHAIDPRKMLVITTRLDTVVPLEFQERLWRAMGRPKRIDVFSGHYTAILYLPWITDEVVAFFHEKLAPRPTSVAKVGR